MERAEPGHDRAGEDDAAMAGLTVGVAGMVLTGGACRLTTDGRPSRGIADGAGGVAGAHRGRGARADRRAEAIGGRPPRCG